MATQELSKYNRFRKDTAISNPATWFGFADNLVMEIPYAIDRLQNAEVNNKM